MQSAPEIQKTGAINQLNQNKNLDGHQNINNHDILYDTLWIYYGYIMDILWDVCWNGECQNTLEYLPSGMDGWKIPALNGGLNGKIIELQ